MEESNGAWMVDPQEPGLIQLAVFGAVLRFLTVIFFHWRSNSTIARTHNWIRDIMSGKTPIKSKVQAPPLTHSLMPQESDLLSIADFRQSSMRETSEQASVEDVTLVSAQADGASSEEAQANAPPKSPGPAFGSDRAIQSNLV